MKIQNPSGFTLVELLIVVAITALLVSILIPVVSKARARAASVACLSNLRQLGIGFGGYIDDYDGELPMEFRSGGPDEGYGYNGRWYVRLAGEGYIGASIIDYARVDLSARGIIHCPAFRGRDTDDDSVWEIADYAPPSWLFVYAPHVSPVTRPPDLHAVTSPSAQVALADTQWNTAFFNPGAPQPYGFWKMDQDKRHGDFRNYLFLDGHVASIPNADVLADPAQFFDPRN